MRGSCQIASFHPPFSINRAGNAGYTYSGAPHVVCCILVIRVIVRA